MGEICSTIRPQNFCKSLSLTGMAILLYTALVSLVITTSSAFAQNDSLLLRSTFDAGDYQVTAKLAYDLVAKNPRDALAHYYLAASYAKMNQRVQARAEYTKCLNLARGSALGTSATKGLALLDESKEKALSADPEISHAAAAERERLLKVEAAEKQEVRKSFDQKIKLLQTEEGTTPEKVRVNTEKAFDELSKAEEAITNRYRKRADALLVQDRAAQGGSTAAQSIPIGSGGNVQNYQNLDDESKAATIPTENPLKAKARKLGEPVSGKAGRP